MLGEFSLKRRENLLWCDARDRNCGTGYSSLRAIPSSDALAWPFSQATLVCGL
jgi:hypothetical protein